MAKIREQENNRSKQDGHNLGARKQKICWFLAPRFWPSCLGLLFSCSQILAILFRSFVFLLVKIWEQENNRSKQDGQNLGARKQ
jgi:hypothetical protein